MSAWDLMVDVGLVDPPTAASPAWTDVSYAVMSGDGVNLARGATSGDTAGPGQATFTLDIDAMAARHSATVTGPGLLRRPVRFRARRRADGVTYPLGRFHVTDTVTLRDGRRRIRVTCTDSLALWEETRRGGDLAWHMGNTGSVRRWRLDDEGPAARDALAGGELVELQVGDAAAGSDTYGDVRWAAGSVPCPSGAGVVRFDAADTFGNGGFTGLTGQVPTAELPFALSAWVRVPEPPLTPGGWPAPPFALHIPAIQVDRNGYLRWIGLSIDRATGAVLPATGWQGPGGAASATGTMDCGYGWVHVDYHLPASGSASLWVTRADGTSENLSSHVSLDPLVDWIGSGGPRLAEGPTRLILGGTTAAAAGVLLVKPASVELSDVILSQPTTSGRTTLVRAALGWPGETPSARVTRVTGEAGIAAPAMTATSYPAMTSSPDARSTVAEALREVETLLLGMLHVTADGTAALLTRAELEDATPVATLTGALVLRDSDGVTNNTSMIVNGCTVTGGAPDVSATATDTVSASTYGPRSDDRSMATVDADWLALAAGWLANRNANPAAAFGLPALQVDPDVLAAARPDLGVLPFTADIGDVLTLVGIADAAMQARIVAVSWVITSGGQWRCQWTVRPHAAVDWLDIDTDDIDGTAIMGW